MKKVKLVVVSVAVSMSIAGLSFSAGMDPMQDEVMGEMVEANTAWAEIQATSPEQTISGTVIFTEVPTGLQVNANLSGAPAGAHGFHIHTEGSCDDEGKAAGGHYNPSGSDHGFLPNDGMGHAHAGDMGNIEVDADGNAMLHLELAGLTLNGVNNIVGRAVIVHADPDDFGQPAGNAGGRIGCGVVQSDVETEPMEMMHGSGTEYKGSH